MIIKGNQKFNSILMLIGTLTLIYFVRNSLLAAGLLLVFWYFGFKPLKKEEVVLFFIVSLIFTAMDSVVLTTGIFEFANKDFYLMPFYEIFMWGFYFLLAKRFIGDTYVKQKSLKVPIFYALTFAVCFSVIKDFSVLFISSTAVLFSSFYFFQEQEDIMYMFFMLVLGLIIECFGTLTGLWFYTNPELIIIPYWFIDLWMFAGLIERRLGFPLIRRMLYRTTPTTIN